MSMNKEVIIAISIGVLLGLGGALYFSNIKPSNNNSASLPDSQVVSPKLAGNTGSLAKFDRLPKNGSLLTKNTINIQGTASKNSALFIANQTKILPVPIIKNAFNQDFRLKPGLNELILFEVNKDREQLKVLKLYYLETGKSTSSMDKTATEEADILKQKLEEKVLELRDNPKRVVNGTINSINNKIITIENSTGIEKLTVEPEITNFYRVNGSELEAIGYEDLEKSDQITAFVSDIGGDEISYTLYQEPITTIAAGKVSNIDDKNYSVTIIDFDKSTFGADIETNTLQNVYNQKTKKVEKGGFSKLAIGQRIMAILNGSKGNYTIKEYLILQ